MNIFSQEDLELLRNLPEVVNATTSTFSITLPERIQQVLLEKWGLWLTTVPVRRMQGDTKPHVDFGAKSFENTYLAYLTDGEGTLEIGDASYPITAGSGFVFPSGTRHGVIGTNGSSRLMLGPMSEHGLSVGGPTTVYIRQNGAVQESSSDQENWTQITWPLNVYGGQTILFTTDLVLTDATAYFICNGDNITIGSRFLKNDGTRTKITIDGVANYPGLVQNSGCSNVLIYNIYVASVNGSFVAGSAGWIGAYGYGTDGTNNYIFYCSSDGPISNYSGGIVGGEACTLNVAPSADLTLVGCSSSGAIDEYGGGIAGEYLGTGGGTVTLLKCWSVGAIGNNAGGLVGIYAGTNEGTVTADRCYSLGIIGQNSGGIFGTNAGEGATVAASYCYSQGSIGADAGGIFGKLAGTDGGTATATGCYSSGAISGGNGIFGASAGTVTALNCYTANGSWSTITATAALGLTNYVEVMLNQPFFLRNIGPSPYTEYTVEEDGEDLTLTYSQTVAAGVPSTVGVTAGNTYLILSGSGGTINASTGAITVATAGNYTFTVLASDGMNYSVTTVALTVTGGVPTPLAVPEPRGKGVDFEIYTDTQIGKRLVQERLQNPNIRFNSFADYHKYKMALLKKNLR